MSNAYASFVLTVSLVGFSVGLSGCKPGAGESSTPSLAPTSPIAEIPTPEATPLPLAKVTITTFDGSNITSKDVSIAGDISIDANGLDPSIHFQAAGAFKGRGNSTWDFPKKPCKIKLNTSDALMGMPADREWVLLANYSDKTLMRTTVAMELGRRLGMSYVPRTQNVSLNLNGRELGSYILTEQIRVSPSRVNAVATDVTGGYLIELDQRLDGTSLFMTSRSTPYTIKNPSSPSAAKYNYIRDYVQAAEDALHSSDFADPLIGYAKYIDVDSFIDWYLVNEIVKNSDAANFSSIYFYKSSGEKLKMGPIWDFDTAIGNNDYTDAQNPEGWWIKTNSVWFSRLFDDPAFAARVRTRWNQLHSLSADRDALIAFIDLNAKALGPAQRDNFEIWDILGIYVWPNPVITGSYAGEVAYMKQWLVTRMNWMDSQFNP